MPTTATAMTAQIIQSIYVLLTVYTIHSYEIAARARFRARTLDERIRNKDYADEKRQ
jgi:hypothetical protein